MKPDEIQKRFMNRDFQSLKEYLSGLSEENLKLIPPQSLSFLGAATSLLGAPKIALRALWYAFLKSPNDPNSRLNLGNCLKDIGDFHGAKEIYLGSEDYKQDDLISLGIAICLIELKEFGEARSFLAESVKRFPKNARIAYQNGRLLLKLEQVRAAHKEFQRSLSLDETLEAAALNLAVVAFKVGDPNLGYHLCDQIVSNYRQTDEFLASILNVTLDVGRPQIGLDFFDKSKKEKSVRVVFLAAEINRMLKNFNKSVELCEEVIRRDPGFDAAHLIICHSLSELGRYDRVKTIKTEKLNTLDPAEIKKSVLPNPWATFSLLSNAESQLKFAIAYGNATYNTLPRVGNRKRPWSANSKNKGQLNIAFFSPDLGPHPVANCVWPLLSSPPPGIKVTVFSLKRHIGEMAEAVSNLPGFVDASEMTYEQIKAAAADRNIDILLDLAVYTAGGKANYLALGLAPIQVNYLGYSGTSGARAYDFIVTDPYISGGSKVGKFSESEVELSVPLLGSLLESRGDIAPLSPDIYGIPEGKKILSCLAQPYKFTAEILDAWANILAAVPDSVLLLGVMGQDTKDNILMHFRSRDIDEGRIVFSERLAERRDHLARLKMVDLFLDTFPYNAHSLAGDALSAGVPLVTISGESFASRVAGSLLSGLGLDDLCVSSHAEYEALSIELLSEEARLDRVRGDLERALQQRDWVGDYVADFYSKMKVIGGAVEG